MSVTLEDLAAKVDTGEPLSDVDIELLANTRDIIALGTMANTVRRKIHGSDVTFVRVADLKLADLQTAAIADAANAGEVRIFQTPESLDTGRGGRRQSARPGREDAGLGLLFVRIDEVARRTSGRAFGLEKGRTARLSHKPPSIG